MGMGRFRRISKETPAPNTTAQAPATAPTKAEVDDINRLIKATKGGESVSPLRERRRSTGVFDPSKMPLEPKVSAEATAINNLIKQTASDGTQVLRKRRKSKEGVESNASTPPASNRASPTALKSGDGEKVRFAVPANDKAHRAVQVVEMSDEARDINRRIAEDRRVRRASQQLEQAEKAALLKMSAMNKKVADAEAEAERLELEHGTALTGAQARGAAKAAATKAGGVFMTSDDHTALTLELKALRAQVAQLQDEKQERQSLITRLATKVQNAEQAQLVENPDGDDGSPTRFSSPSSRPLRRQKSSENGSFLNKVRRSVSPSLRRSPSMKQKAARPSWADKDDNIPTGVRVVTVATTAADHTA